MGEELADEPAAHLCHARTEHLAHGNLLAALLDVIGAHGHQAEHADEQCHAGKEQQDGEEAALGLERRCYALLHPGHAVREVLAVHLLVYLLHRLQRLPLVALDADEDDACDTVVHRLVLYFVDDGHLGPFLVFLVAAGAQAEVGQHAVDIHQLLIDWLPFEGTHVGRNAQGGVEVGRDVGVHILSVAPFLLQLDAQGGQIVLVTIEALEADGLSALGCAHIVESAVQGHVHAHRCVLHARQRLQLLLEEHAFLRVLLNAEGHQTVRLISQGRMDHVQGVVGEDARNRH